MEVTAVDVSEQMLQVLNRNADEMQLQVQTVQSSFQQLKDKIEENLMQFLSETHYLILSTDELKETLQNFILC